MIALVPLQKILAVVALVYAVAIAAVVGVFQLSGGGSISPAIRGAVVLEVCLLLFGSFGWRWLWAKLPVLNDWIYPDLNGEWQVEIYWNRGAETGKKYARAHIKQDLFRLSMEFISDESESETLMVKPQKDPESARPLLYYIYRNESAQGVQYPRPPHKGAAILKLDAKSRNSLKGNYFTDHASNGHFELTREQ